MDGSARAHCAGYACSLASLECIYQVDVISRQLNVPLSQEHDPTPEPPLQPCTEYMMLADSVSLFLVLPGGPRPLPLT